MCGDDDDDDGGGDVHLLPTCLLCLASFTFQTMCVLNVFLCNKQKPSTHKESTTHGTRGDDDDDDDDDRFGCWIEGASVCVCVFVNGSAADGIDGERTTTTIR